MTIIYSNMLDDDCRTLRRIWQGFDVNLVEITSEIDIETAETLVDDAISAEQDMLILCGHGDINGLYYPNWNSLAYLIHENNANLIKAKTVICLWCFARTWLYDNDCKFNKNVQQILASDMFISNVDEAYNNGYTEYSQYDIDLVNTYIFDDINYCIKNAYNMANTMTYIGIHTNFENSIDFFNRQTLSFYINN